jgi:hypothetical protein
MKSFLKICFFFKKKNTQTSIRSLAMELVVARSGDVRDHSGGIEWNAGTNMAIATRSSVAAELSAV